VTETRHEEMIGALAEAFGNRLRRTHPRDAVSVSPTGVGEARLLAEIAGRYSVPLIPLGAGTGDGSRPQEGVLVRFDLMRGFRLPGDDEPWIEAEPGASWLNLDDELRAHGMGLAMYPTSAPRATVGGWLATDGLGVGSFEYGRLRENVLSADVVTHGGGLREVGDEELHHFFGPGKEAGIVVKAKIRTRRTNMDRPFAAAFSGPGGLAGAIATLVASSAPLWHLAFVSPMMAAARGLRERYLLFGVYPSPRDREVWWELRRRVLEDHGGDELGIREAWRVWGTRFFPVEPAHPTPHAARRFVTVEGLPQALEDSQLEVPFQGTVARSGEVLLLTLGDEENSTQSASGAERSTT
jgi:FAD/FMN-containing dehydrogenase